MAEPTPSKRLHSLGNKPFSIQLEADLRSWLLLPERVQQAYWPLLRLNLAPQIDERISAAVRQMMEKLEAKADELVPSIKANRLLMRSAAALDVPSERFHEDMRALVGDEPSYVNQLTEWYTQALPLLRTELVSSTIAEHGNLASQLAWRVDMVTRSSRGANVNTPVAVFTFRYREGKTEKQLTLQMLPELVGKLRDACDDIIGPKGRPKTNSPEG